jgi:hypothetical protein
MHHAKPSSPKMHHIKPSSPKMHHRHHTQPESPHAFKDCGIKKQFINVPHVTYTLHKKPIVLEKISKNVQYNKVPVTFDFQTKKHPTKVISTPCRSPRQRPRC